MFTTTTVNTVLQNVLSDVGYVLITNLPLIFGFIISISLAFWGFRTIKRHMKGR